MGGRQRFLDGVSSPFDESNDILLIPASFAVRGFEVRLFSALEVLYSLRAFENPREPVYLTRVCDYRLTIFIAKKPERELG